MAKERMCSVKVCEDEGRELEAKDVAKVAIREGVEPGREVIRNEYYFTLLRVQGDGQ